MAVAGAIAGIVSGVVGGIQGMYQAQVAKMNEDVAKYNAVRASQQGGIDAQEKDVFETRALLGEQESAQAASGVTVSGASQIATRDTARMLGRRDAEQIVSNAKVERYNHLVEAANFHAEAGNAMIGAIGSVVGGVIGAAGSPPGSMVGQSKPLTTTSKFAVKPVPKPAPRPSTPSYDPLTSIKTNPLLKRKRLPGIV